MRNTARAICELLSDPNKLQEEREFARKTRDKFSGISSSGATQNSSQFTSSTNGVDHTSAAPASGKYGGFGSEDIDKMGYN